MALVDLVRINISSATVGAFVLGAAVEGYRGTEVLTNGESYSYSIVQGANYEIGRGVYLGTSKQMTRSVIASSGGGIPIDLAPNAAISFVALAQDLETPSFLYPLSGELPPTDATGAIGQFYFQTDDGSDPALVLWGPKTAGGWGEGVPIVGAAGPASAYRVNLSAIKSAPTGDGVSFFAGAVFQWTAGNYSGKADDVTIIASNSSPLSVGAWVRQTRSLGGVRIVSDYGADPTGAVDSLAAFIAAGMEAGIGGAIIVPPGTYLVSDFFDVLDGQTWSFEGVVFTHDDDTKTFIRIDSKTDFTIEGNLTLTGLLETAEDTGEIGLHITSGKRYRIEGVTAVKFKGAGILLDGTDAGTYRGDRGQFTDCATHECFTGLQVDAGAGAEYNTWSNFCASGNIVAVEIGAGNNTFVGGSIVDNTTGVKLVSGPNHGHGMFIGTNINHNQAENIHAIGVTNGYTFVGCHIYGNGGTTGAVWLDGSKGIVLASGIIDCHVFNDIGTGSGANWVINNYFPGDYGVQISTNNGGTKQIYLYDNAAPSGPSPLNDQAGFYVEATRASTAQDLSAGSTTILFNNEIYDRREVYDPTTGVFTAPFPCTVVDEAVFTVLAASGLANSYIALVKNNSIDISYAGIMPLPSGTIGVGGQSVSVSLDTGDTLRWKSTITGTSPTLATSQSRRTIRLLQ